jgi:hypothetical protein
LGKIIERVKCNRPNNRENQWEIKNARKQGIKTRRRAPSPWRHTGKSFVWYPWPISKPIPGFIIITSINQTANLLCSLVIWCVHFGA